MLILETLRSQVGFTPTEKRIADFILQNVTDIPEIYVQELAKKTYSSHSAVIRLCKKMGYTGFRTFKTAISEVVYTKLHTIDEVNVNFPFDGTSTPLEIAKIMADLTMNTVKKTLVQLDDQLLNQAADILSHAERIYLFSRGDSQLRARIFQNKLVKINKLAIVAEEYADEAWNASNLTEKDCALFISYSGTVPLYKKMMSYFYEEKIPTLLLTGNPKSPLVKFATLPIITIQEEYDFAKVATFSSQTAFEYILDTLFSIMYSREYQKNVLHLKAKQTLLQTGRLAYPDDE